MVAPVKNPGMSIEPEAFARVAIPGRLRDPLIYKVPESLRNRVAVGIRVLIPLGKATVTGLVLELLRESSVTETREILSELDEQPIIESTLLDLSQWIAQYYLADLGEVFGAILPPSLRRETQRTISLKPGVYSVREALDKRILEWLHEKKRRVAVKRLTREISTGGSLARALERLQSMGAIEIHERLPGHRKISPRVLSAAHSVPVETDHTFTLSSEQNYAVNAIQNRLQNGGFETFLLHGVTGSGKTEVYLRCMEQTRRLGRRSLILIPEISLTPQLIDRLNRRFPGRVGVLHSALSGTDRWSQWWSIVHGEVDVVVGARSAVFAPLRNLGLIVVDEEHDPSYKQEEGFRYNGRDVAVVRGKLSTCPVILGSATPAIESYQNSLEGRYRLLEMTQRVQQRSLPSIEIIDLRSKTLQNQEQIDGKPALRMEPKTSAEYRLISERFGELLTANYHASRQSLIFLNRRGFANFLQCVFCGHVLRCDHCSVTLTFHRAQKIACCHHCNFRRPAGDCCPECGNPSLSGVGVGTEQIEEVLKQLVPQARIARMDRDTTTKRGSHEQLIRSWEKGAIDILVGTQMITKGHDVIGVTLVGALLADLSLNLPDFRAGERTFQLLNQVAGRSGRGDAPGTVIIQTYAPDHYAIRHLLNHDYAGFFADEIAFRRALNYPPFTRLVCLRLEGLKGEEVEKKARILAITLRDKLARSLKTGETTEILGPAPAPIQKLRNRYRWQLLLKSRKASTLLELAKYARSTLPRSRRVRLHVDVDPNNML